MHFNSISVDRKRLSLSLPTKVLFYAWRQAKGVGWERQSWQKGFTLHSVQIFTIIPHINVQGIARLCHRQK